MDPYHWHCASHVFVGDLGSDKGSYKYYAVSWGGC